MSNEFYFEADGKLHRAAWMPALGTHYESIWNGHAWDHQGRMDEDEVKAAKVLEISHIQAHAKYMNYTDQQCQVVTEVIDAASMLDHHDCGGEG